MADCSFSSQYVLGQDVLVALRFDISVDATLVLNLLLYTTPLGLSSNDGEVVGE